MFNIFKHQHIVFSKKGEKFAEGYEMFDLTGKIGVQQE